MDDVLIVGGGVIGLSLAWELASAGQRVRLVERGELGREASWAGAGILPPGRLATATDPGSQLLGLSFELHAAWAEQLREATGIDTGYRRCGAFYLGRTAELAQWLTWAVDDWRRRDIVAEQLAYDDARRLEPALALAGSAEPPTVVHVPEECQLRNPWHLRALAEACRRRGVTIETGVGIEDFECQGERVVAARGGDVRRMAGSFCLTGGAWTTALAETLGALVLLKPVRGQIALLRTARPPLSRVVNDGLRYLVPRGDGRVLVGATEEEAGFDKRNTAEGVAGLLQLAVELVPALAEATLEQCWAGLRPASRDGLPTLGRLPRFENAYVAAGHFRSGLTLSTGTAVVMRRLICGEPPPIEIAAFAPGR